MNNYLKKKHMKSIGLPLSKFDFEISASEDATDEVKCKNFHRL